MGGGWEKGFCFQPGLLRFLLSFYPLSVVGWWWSGVGVDCRLYLSVVVVCCWLSGVSFSNAYRRLSVVAVVGCCRFLVVELAVVGSWFSSCQLSGVGF